MHQSHLSFLLLGLALTATPVAAAQLEGMLELRWGDPEPGALADAQFTVDVVADDGTRYRLDTDSALDATGDLFALAGRHVVVDVVAHAMTPGGLAVAEIGAVDPASSRELAQPSIVGTSVWVTLMCKFADIATEQRPLSFFNGQYGNVPGALDHYWREVSYAKINLLGSSAYGWFTLPLPRSGYITGSGSGATANLSRLWTDCTAAADGAVNFAANGGVQGINMMFNGDLDGYAWGGGRCGILDGINRCWSSTWNPPWSFSNIAPLAHEMGHGYGLPHANNSDRDSDPYDNPWDVMSSSWSNATSNPTYGTNAKHLNIYSRDRLGWIDAARKLVIATDGTVSGIRLDRASLAASGNVQMVKVMRSAAPGVPYCTIEVRQRAGYYEGNLAGTAVIIHEVDSTRQEPSWSVDAAVPPANVANNEGSMFKVGETWRSADGVVTVSVDAPTAEGFLISVTRIGDRIFASGFD